MFVEHNRAGVLALEHSIIGKKKSIICMSLMVGPGLATPLTWGGGGGGGGGQNEG